MRSSGSSVGQISRQRYRKGDFHFVSSPALGREGDGETVCDVGYGEILVLELFGRLVNKPVFIHQCQVEDFLPRSTVVVVVRDDNATLSLSKLLQTFVQAMRIWLIIFIIFYLTQNAEIVPPVVSDVFIVKQC